MPRSHPPSLLTSTVRTLRDLNLEGGARILIAVSGGPDSMALLHVLARSSGKLHMAIAAHGVDHGLRAEAAAELDLAEHLARTLDVPFDRTCLALRDGGNLQARARTARYEALREAARRAGASFIATAHHADDRAETVLLRLLRGAGPAGLAVLPPRAGDLIRPFIHARRAAIEGHLARHAIPSASDPSNRDPRFSRVRVRHELLPQMVELSPNIVEHLCALADQLAQLPSVHAGIPRATRDALASLAASRSSTMRVSLPGGLVATYDRTQGKVVVGPASAFQVFPHPEKLNRGASAPNRGARARRQG